MTLDEKLDNFYKSAINDATNKSEQIIDEYKESLNKIFEEHKSDAVRKANLDLQIEKDNYIRERNKNLSIESIKIKRNISEKNNQLVEILFEDVSKKLEAFMKTPEYTSLLIKQIKEAKQFARGEEITIYINPSDESKKAELEAATDAALTISSYSFMGGTRAVIPSKNILIDNSFQNKMDEIKDKFTLD